MYRFDGTDVIYFLSMITFSVDVVFVLVKLLILALIKLNLDKAGLSKLNWFTLKGNIWCW